MKTGKAASYWIHCPICNGKTHTKARKDSLLQNFPLFCPKCKRETLVTIKELNTSVITEPDA